MAVALSRKNVSKQSRCAGNTTGWLHAGLQMGKSNDRRNRKKADP